MHLNVQLLYWIKFLILLFSSQKTSLMIFNRYECLIVFCVDWSFVNPKAKPQINQDKNRCARFEGF